MSEPSNKRAVVVGIFVLVGLMFLVAGVLTIGNIKGLFTKKIEVTAIFDNVNGLQVGNNIWFSGVKIGTVKKLEFYDQSKVRVVMNIERRTQEYIRKNAKAKISSDGLIGNKIIEIYGGSAFAAHVVAGDTLGVEKGLSTEQMMATFQQNNKNVLDITSDLKTISKKLAKGEGTIGKLLNDETVYEQIASSATSLKNTTGEAQKMVGSLSKFTSNLNKKGTLAHELTTDTVIFQSMKSSAIKLNRVTDSAAVAVNSIKRATTNTHTPIGVLLYDEEAGNNVKSTLRNMDSGSKKLDEDLEALQHNFLFRRFFKKKAKEKEKQQENK